jgi:hypothetical protein
VPTKIKRRPTHQHQQFSSRKHNNASMSSASEYNPLSGSESSDAEEEPGIREAMFEDTYWAAFYAYLRSVGGGSKSVEEARYTTAIVQEYFAFAIPLLPADQPSKFSEKDRCLTTVSFYQQWITSLQKLTKKSSARAYLSRFSRFIRYRELQGDLLDTQHGMVCSALVTVKVKLLELQRQLGAAAQKEYAQEQSVEALESKGEWCSFALVVRCVKTMQATYFEIIDAQAANSRKRMPLKTRVWCLQFVLSSLYVHLSAARCEFLLCLQVLAPTYMFVCQLDSTLPSR